MVTTTNNTHLIISDENLGKAGGEDSRLFDWDKGWVVIGGCMVQWGEEFLSVHHAICLGRRTRFGAVSFTLSFLFPSFSLFVRFKKEWPVSCYLAFKSANHSNKLNKANLNIIYYTHTPNYKERLCLANCMTPFQSGNWWNFWRAHDGIGRLGMVFGNANCDIRVFRSSNDSSAPDWP